MMAGKPVSSKTGFDESRDLWPAEMLNQITSKETQVKPRPKTKEYSVPGWGITNTPELPGQQRRVLTRLEDYVLHCVLLSAVSCWPPEQNIRTAPSFTCIGHTPAMSVRDGKNGKGSKVSTESFQRNFENGENNEQSKLSNSV